MTISQLPLNASEGTLVAVSPTVPALELNELRESIKKYGLYDRVGSARIAGAAIGIVGAIVCGCLFFTKRFEFPFCI